MSLGSSAMNWLAAASNGRRMLTPKEFSVPAPSMPAAMIPGPAPVMTIQSRSAMACGEGPGLLVERVLRLRPGRPEDGHLPLAPVGLEDVEGVPHLLERRVGDLEVAPGGGVAGHPQGGDDHLEDEVDLFGGAGPGHELGDGGVELGVACPVAGESFHNESMRLPARKAAEIFPETLTDAQPPPISPSWPTATSTTTPKPSAPAGLPPADLRALPGGGPPRSGPSAPHCALVRAGLRSRHARRQAAGAGPGTIS